MIMAVGTLVALWPAEGEPSRAPARAPGRAPAAAKPRERAAELVEA